jgi:hypothetical protein
VFRRKCALHPEFGATELLLCKLLPETSITIASLLLRSQGLIIDKGRGYISGFGGAPLAKEIERDES